MRFAYLCSEGVTLTWPRRLLEEGNDVMVYVPKDTKKVMGKGIVPLATSKEQWIAWGMQDRETIWFFDCTDHGELADMLTKRGCLVIGGGSFMDKLEKDRHWGEEVAKSVGILCPPTKQFTNISSVIDFLKKGPKQEVGDGGWAWKPDKDIGCDATLVAKDNEKIIAHVEHIRRRFSDKLKCILQEKIDGVAVSTAQWFNGHSFVGPIEATIENKKFMNDNLGPATGCSFNVVWFYDPQSAGKIRESLKLNDLASMFRQQKAPPGLYDVNSILNSQGAWFLEWTPRLGVDSEITSQHGISNLSQFLSNLVLGKEVDSFFDTSKAYFDIRLSVPPYPFIGETKDESPAFGIPVKGMDGLTGGMFAMGQLMWTKEAGFQCASGEGMIGYVVTSGNSVKKTFTKMYEWIKDNMDVPDLQYRTDCHEVIQKDIDKMIKFGWPTTLVLRK